MPWCFQNCYATGHIAAGNSIVQRRQVVSATTESNSCYARRELPELALLLIWNLPTCAKTAY